MATTKKTRRFWLAELKRAKLEKQKFIENLMNENFTAVNKFDADEQLKVLEFCEGQHRHFIATFETWINDNYPAEVKAPQLFDTITTNSLESAKVFTQVFGEHFTVKPAGQ